MPGVGSIMNKVCIELKSLPTKILCVMLVILQSFFMDVIIIQCYGSGFNTEETCTPCKRCYWWIAGDVVVVALFIAAFVVSYKHLAYHKKFKRLQPQHMKGGLPLSCLAWFIYSGYVAAKVAVIFTSGIANKLSSEDFYGPQFLKTGICLCGVVFILFVAAHHHAKENTKDRMYINSMATGVTFDVLDTVDFLDILFVEENKLILPFGLEDAVLAIALINLMRPTFSFIVLMLNHFGATKIGRELTAANALVSILLVNAPFMAIRMYLWHNLSRNISVFLIKNFVMIFIGIHEIYEIGIEKTRDDIDKFGIEMTPRLTPAHRPTDLIDSGADDGPSNRDSLVASDNKSVSTRD